MMAETEMQMVCLNWFQTWLYKEGQQLGFLHDVVLQTDVLKLAKSRERKHQTEADLECYVVVDCTPQVNTSEVALQSLDGDDIVSLPCRVLETSVMLTHKERISYLPRYYTQS